MASHRAEINNIIFDDSTESETEGATGRTGGIDTITTQRSGRKRVRNPKLWRSTIAKRCRTAGDGYRNRSRNNPADVPPICKTARSCHCKRLCFNSVTEEMRESVIKAFYAIKTKDLQDSYLFGLITPMSVKQRRKRLPDSNRQRGGSFLYKVSYIYLSSALPEGRSKAKIQQHLINNLAH